jgi:hypothetical protein
MAVIGAREFRSILAGRATRSRPGDVAVHRKQLKIG